MDNINKIEVYYNEWTSKYVIAFISEDIDATFECVDTMEEVRAVVSNIERLCPDVKIEIYE